MLQADVFVLPTLAEGSARVIFEALAAGCWVITTPNAGSIVPDVAAGAVVPPADPHALAEAIANVLADPGAARLAGAENASLIRDRFTQDRYGFQLSKLFSDLNTARS
jgi:glycosyltransferase involved in cell wall biosynthesis